MSDKDPPPFGYHITGNFFDGGPSTLDTTGQSLLNDTETQSLADFFTLTDFQNADPQPFASVIDAKHSVHDFNNWDNFVAPATVHRVTTTVPDQAHLQHGFHHDQPFAQSSSSFDHLGNTHDDLQAANTLFNSQPFYTNGRSQSYHGVPPLGSYPLVNGVSEHTLGVGPMVVTPHGPLNEQLAALLPKHSENGTLDAQFAASWASSELHQRYEAEFGPRIHKPSLKRSITFGTDNSFNNPSGYSPPHSHHGEDHARRSIHDLQQSQTLLRAVTGGDGPGVSPTEQTQLSLKLAHDPSDEEPSEDITSEEEDDEKPAKKRRKSTYRVSKQSPKKGARNGKNRKSLLADESAKKKRLSAAAQKLQRENLTEEQKRSNHILSEQKRRNLIKRGFDDLHDLVPEIRNGGLSKSSVLMEAGNFLEKLIQDNIAYWRVTSGGNPVTGVDR